MLNKPLILKDHTLQNITIICDAGLYFDDYTQSKTLECTSTVDLAIHNCQVGFLF